MSTSSYAIVAGDFVPTGGMDRANLALASAMARAKSSTHLVAYRADESILANRGVRFHRVPRPFQAYALGAPLLGLQGLIVGTGVALGGGSVVVNGGSCPFPGINWVHYVHAAYTPHSPRHAWRSSKLAISHCLSLATERFALRRARVVVANSERTRRDLIRLIGLSPEVVHTIYYGVDPQQFAPPSGDARRGARAALGWHDERPRVVFIGALGDRRKGFDTLYESWKLIHRRMPSWDGDLIVVGIGAELADWRARARRDGLQTNVHFLGFRNDVPLILAATDMLVAPTRYEAYGLGVHEALCCGVPALVSRTAGVAERYPDSMRGLLLAEPESPEALALALIECRTSLSGLRSAVTDFAARLRTRSWDDMALDILALCR